MIIFIGRLSVALGIIISLITISTGFGSKKAIKERLADFTGHISVRSTRSNASYNTTTLSKDSLHLEKIKANPHVAHVQKFATVTGILRNEKNFDGIIFKGIGHDFDHDRFKKFLIEGTTPIITEKEFHTGITISQKLAQNLQLKLHDSIVAIFSKEETKNPIYRKFEVIGIYKTDIKMIDDMFVIGGINHVRKIQGMERDEYGGLDVFLDNVNNIDKDFDEIEKEIGFKNYAEKPTDKYPQIKDWITIFDTNIALIIIIMLIVVVINIIMVLLILIIERTNSIGLLKTLGATNGEIQKTFIYYTLYIMIPGLVVGNIIGIGILLLQRFFGIIQLNPENYYVSTVPVDLNPLAIISVSLGILIISALALIIPSMIISKISPAKVIKYN